MSVGAKFMQRFFNITTDAVPQPPRVEIEDVSEENRPSVEEPTDTQHVPSSTPHVASHALPKQKASKKAYTKIKNNGVPFQPVRTQATGNVINIINSAGSHVGSVITYHIGSCKNEENNENNELGIKKTKSISALLASTDQVEHKYMAYLSRNIGTRWRDIFRSLGLTEGFIEITYEDNINKGGVSEVIYQLLMDFARNEGTLGKLTTLLWNEGKRSVVKEMAVLYKNEKIEETADNIKKQY